MLLTKEQISEQMRKHAEKKNGLHDLMVIYIGNMPVESAAGWGEIFDALKDRGLQRVGLMVADGIKGLDTVVGERFPGTQLQRCITHLKRNMFAKVRHGDKSALAAFDRAP